MSFEDSIFESKMVLRDKSKCKERKTPLLRLRSGVRIFRAILKAFFFVHPVAACVVFGGYRPAGCLRYSRLRREGSGFDVDDDLLALHRNLPFAGGRFYGGFVHRDVFGWVCDYSGGLFAVLAADPAR